MQLIAYYREIQDLGYEERSEGGQKLDALWTTNTPSNLYSTILFYTDIKLIGTEFLL